MIFCLENRGGFLLSYINRIVGIIARIAFVLLIPYYCIINSNTTTLGRIQTNYLISDIFSQWQSPGFQISLPSNQEVFWQQNQILYSILFILPMVLFAFFFSERETDIESIVLGIGATVTSYALLYRATPMFNIGTIAPYYDKFVPNVVSLSMFIFVFWSLLRNSFPSKEVAGERIKKEGLLPRIREVLGKLFPRSVTTLIWICLVIFPTYLILNVYVPSETETQLSLYLMGGLYSLSSDYISLPGPSIHYPVIRITTNFMTAVWASFFTIAVWIVNLLVGIAAILFIRGKIRKWIFDRLVWIVFVILVIPNILMTLIAGLSFASGYYNIPLPFYLIAMVLVAKYVHLPTESSEEMIQVPFRTRLSSLLHRSSQDEKNPDIEQMDNVEDDDEIDGTS